MRVHAVCHLYVPEHGAGAEWMLHTILRSFVAAGDECDVTVRDYHGEPYVYDGVGVWPHDWCDQFASTADVIVTHLDLTQHAVALGRQHHTPVVHLVHNDNQLKFHRVRRDEADLVVFNSAWLAQKVGWPGPQVVCRPHVVVADYATTPGDMVTLVNLNRAKGSNVFYAMALRDPKRSYLGVRGAYGPQDIRPKVANVEIVDNTPDMRTVYGRTRVLVMPSQYESWGRVAIEAACSGIPTIAADTPGLVESLGGAGMIVSNMRPNDWLGALRMLDDEAMYGAASTLARERAHALEIDTAADIELLHGVMLDLVHGRHPAHRNAPSVAVLIPWRHAPERKAALELVCHHYAERHPAWTVYLGEPDDEVWSKGAALTNARDQLDRHGPDADVLVIADADCIADPVALDTCVEAVASGEATWAVPHTTVRRLTETATRSFDGYEHDERPAGKRLPSKTGGGIVVVDPDVWEDVGGIDERFVGWGGEDLALGWTLRMLHGAPHVERTELWHLWHPEAVRKRNAPELAASAALLARYRAVRANPEGLRAILDERYADGRSTTS